MNGNYLLKMPYLCTINQEKQSDESKKTHTNIYLVDVVHFIYFLLQRESHK